MSRPKNPFNRVGKWLALGVSLMNLGLLVVGLIQGDPWWQAVFRLFIASTFAWIFVDSRFHPIRETKAE